MTGGFFPAHFYVGCRCRPRRRDVSPYKHETAKLNKQHILPWQEWQQIGFRLSLLRDPEYCFDQRLLRVCRGRRPRRPIFRAICKKDGNVTGGFFPEHFYVGCRCRLRRRDVSPYKHETAKLNKQHILPQQQWQQIGFRLSLLRDPEYCFDQRLLRVCRGRRPRRPICRAICKKGRECEREKRKTIIRSVFRPAG